ncbi:MAG: YqhA family protein [Coriobacteriia bacterium]|nr:YqhA family protein [Coriobacteriia bacterium]
MNRDNLHINESGFKELPEEEERHVVARVIGWTRVIASIPAAGLFIASVALSIETFVNLVLTTFELATRHLSVSQAAIEYVEYTDLFLLGVALFVLSLGLIRLFVTEKVPLPSWLDFCDFDDLKERLASVISIMLAVYFLGFVLKGGAATDILLLGAGCGCVIVALAVFVKNVFKLH